MLIETVNINSVAKTNYVIKKPVCSLLFITGNKKSKL